MSKVITHTKRGLKRVKRVSMWLTVNRQIAKNLTSIVKNAVFFTVNREMSQLSLIKN